MTVPALTTDNIGAFAWWRQDGCYSVELSDVLDYVIYYEQQPEYVDTIVFMGVGYGPVNVRIRSDGYILAWQSKEWSDVLHTIQSKSGNFETVITPTTFGVDYYYGSNSLESNNELNGAVIEMKSGTHSGKQYMITASTGTTLTVHTATDGLSYDTLSNGDTFRIYSSRGGLIYNSTGTVLAHTIKLIWDQLRGNQIGGSGDALTDYTEVNNYDYEYTNATSLHVFGKSLSTGNPTNTGYFYFTQPSGNTIYYLGAKTIPTDDVCDPYINLNGTRVIGSNTTNDPFNNIKDVSTALLRSIQVRNEATCNKGYWLTYFYFLALTND